MPEYRFYDLAAPEAGETERLKLFDDAVAMRRAMGEQFPAGCEVWQGLRFVGRFHRPAPTRAPER